jgi:glycosyltransferase involved in cell wall biosynthesis
MHLGLIDGPGHHGQVMLTQLVAKGHTVTTTRPYPRFDAFTHGDGATPVSLASRFDARAHDLVRRVTAGAQHRLRRYIRSSYDFDVHSRVYGRIASRYLSSCQAVIGFGFVSYEGHHRAKQRGQFTVLEWATTHLASYMELLREEHGRAGVRPGGGGLIFSSFAMKRVVDEYNQADLINVLSSYAKQTLVDGGIPAAKILVTPLGVDTDFFKPAPAAASSSRPFRVLCVGRVELIKGVQYLLEAFARLDLPDAELRLVGQVNDDARQLLQRYPRSVVVCGHLSPDALPACYQEADLLVFPSISDGFGLAILEAMACGLPVVATSHSGGPDVIREGKDGFIVPIRDTDALADRISWCYQRTEERLAMGLSARSRVEAMFKLSHYADRLQNGVIAAIPHRR